MHYHTCQESHTWDHSNALFSSGWLPRVFRLQSSRGPRQTRYKWKKKGSFFLVPLFLEDLWFSLYT